MYIVLDTNTLQEDLLLRSKKYDMLVDYGKRTISPIFVPKLVLDELLATYARKLRERSATWIRSVEQMNGLLTAQIQLPPSLEIESLCKTFRLHLFHKLAIAERSVLPLKPEYLTEVVDRAIHRRAPCNASGEGIRDALFWLSARDLAVRTKHAVALISKSTSQFSADRTTLHPDLAVEARAAGAAIVYYPSIVDFIKEHATQIEFITADWLTSHVPGERILDRVRPRLERLATRRLEKLCSSDEEPTGDVEVRGGTLKLGEHFVYRMSNGSIGIESTWTGRVEVRFRVSHTETEWRYSLDPLTRTMEPEWERSRSHAYCTGDLEVAVRVEITVEDGAVAGWSADATLA
jgi:hypothetical protein